MDTPCLWDVVTDPEERHDLNRPDTDTDTRARYAPVLALLTRRAREINATYIERTFDRGEPDHAAECAAAAKLGGFFGPWVGQVVSVGCGIYSYVYIYIAIYI